MERVAVKISEVHASAKDVEAITPYIVLQDDAGREVQIFIGQFEAQALSLGFTGFVPEHPQTYEAMLMCLQAAGGTVEEVSINEIRGETFYAEVSLRAGDQSHSIDMRPSDALNLAVRTGCSIFVNEKMLISQRQPEVKPTMPTQESKVSPIPPSADVSEELARLYAEDQSDRASYSKGQLHASLIGPRDAARLARVIELYRGEALQSGMDFYHAAMVLHHSSQPVDTLLAHEFCIVAISKGTERAKWLAAASEDRFLLRTGLPQRFGTQGQESKEGGTQPRSEVSLEVNDYLRREFHVPPLAQE